ncbi:hypothetical protein JKY72_06855 [Candidatus Gracilibacteria bacterium]|nr:hypothetical protein [Candidatus Gracilibacteria bacterium]
MRKDTRNFLATFLLLTIVLGGSYHIHDKIDIYRFVEGLSGTSASFFESESKRISMEEAEAEAIRENNLAAQQAVYAARQAAAAAQEVAEKAQMAEQARWMALQQQSRRNSRQSRAS